MGPSHKHSKYFSSWFLEMHECCSTENAFKNLAIFKKAVLKNFAKFAEKQVMSESLF